MWYNCVHAMRSAILPAMQACEVPLGRGAVDLPALLGALEEYAFRGYVVVAREQPADTEAEIAAAVEFLKNL